ncbi:hypothetical protein RN001_010165 [Aquatica leii]|uniref:Uncharacterized protein n=1 Tax=Aquatica leii TaxID=1421715 RepID=A0AAN7P625_9COLE|nr:hypothetical protein RN001_010165 [Aquatica leii]
MEPSSSTPSPPGLADSTFASVKQEPNSNPPSPTDSTTNSSTSLKIKALGSGVATPDEVGDTNGEEAVDDLVVLILISSRKSSSASESPPTSEFSACSAVISCITSCNSAWLRARFQ